MMNQTERLKQLNQDALYERFINKGFSEWRAKTEASWIADKLE